MSGYGRKSYYAALVGLALVVVVAVSSNKASVKIAELSGSFERASVEAGIGGNALQKGGSNFVLVGSPALISEESPVVIGSIPFTFKSSGARTVDSLAISFQYKSAFRRDILEHAETSVVSPFAGANIDKSTASEADRFFVSYFAKSLNPGVSIRIAEPIFLGETNVRDSVSVRSRDGVDMSVSYRLRYSLVFGVAVSAADTDVVGYSIQVATHKVGSMNELIKVGAAERVQERQHAIRKRLNFIQYVSALITSSPTEDVHLIYMPMDRVGSGEDIVFFSGGSQEVSLLRYDLLSWRLLFAID